MKCRFCLESACIKKGKQNNGIQKYLCKCCGKYQQDTYSKWSWLTTDTEVKTLVKECCGIRSMMRVLDIASNTVMKRICAIARKLKPGKFPLNAAYEMDEVRLFLGNRDNEIWVIYAIERNTREAIAIKVGRRTKLNLGKVIDKILLMNPRKIRTDFLPMYKTLIPEKLHRAGKTVINLIERSNLNLRNRLKRMVRNTICFTRNAKMLEACVKIYLWG
jgi:insertion element IS1 protein InsB